MGAGGSTANSCSSLEAPGARRHHFRLHQVDQANQLKHEQRYRKRQQAPPVVPTQLLAEQAQAMKHSNSYFDLTTAGQMSPTSHHHHPYQAKHLNIMSKSPPASLSSPQAQHHTATQWALEPLEAYAGYAPVLVLPSATSPLRHHHHRGNKSNAGVASRIQQRQQQQQQQQRLNELRKFSDSLPSLNVVLPGDYGDVPSAYVSPQKHSSNKYHHHHHRQERPMSGFIGSQVKPSQSANQQQRKHLVNCSPRRNEPQFHQQQQMKRATSLSSLHNLHSHCQPDFDANCRLDVRQPSQQQPTVAKKIMKFKQVVNGNNNNNNQKYNKLKQQRQQQQQQQQQQGCPVLPPLPRSQSLHELIQLRATENGQRMRTTGTLRGPLASGQEQSTGNKVNLVAELLESKRQEKLLLQQQQKQTNESGNNNSNKTHDTMLSHSSTDDGIHDVSLSHQSTGDSSRLRPASSSANDGKKQRIYKRNSAAADKKLVGKKDLKRSMSQSALIGDAAHEDDADESDDLNELAKFLYQFKQRQQRQQNTCKAETSTSRIEEVNSSEATKSSEQSEQSPNSTSSSSGFASSSTTCSSASLSPRPNQSKLKLATRKKYPAPPRPSDPIEKLLKPKIGLDEPIVTGGRLKLSNSLLSIVDEYNSTLQSGKTAEIGSQLDLDLLPPTCSNLASVLLMGKRKCDLQQVKQSSQLERLRRYTQLRQMSQSELALNQLVATSCNRSERIICSKKQPVVNNNKPYKSKLINIIRRISTDSRLTETTSEGLNNKRSSFGVCGSPGGHQSKHQLEQTRGEAINQSKTTAPSEIIGSSSSNMKSKGGNSNQFRPSESLCQGDLNFDCDLALIKTCSSLSAPQVAANGKASDPQQARNSSAAVGHHHQRRLAGDGGDGKQAEVVGEASGSNSNWRLQLKPAAYSLEFESNTAAKPGGQSIGGLEKQVMGKWPGKGWLMSGSHQVAAEQQKLSGNKSQACCLSKLISANSMAPGTGKPPLASSSKELEEAKVNSEANQLLEELDQSLELVGAADKQVSGIKGSSKAAWWRMDDDLGGGKLALHRLELRGGRVMLNSDYSGSDSSELNSSSSSSLDLCSGGSQGEEEDDDDDDDVAYASFSRAMLQATFELSIPPLPGAAGTNAEAPNGAGSPSNSFTFAASAYSLLPEVGQKQTYSKVQMAKGHLISPNLDDNVLVFQQHDLARSNNNNDSGEEEICCLEDGKAASGKTGANGLCDAGKCPQNPKLKPKPKPKLKPKDDVDGGNHFAVVARNGDRQMDFHSGDHCDCPVQGQLPTSKATAGDILGTKAKLASHSCPACHRQEQPKGAEADNGAKQDDIGDVGEAEATSGPGDRCHCRRRRPIEPNLHQPPVDANGVARACHLASTPGEVRNSNYSAKVGHFCSHQMRSSGSEVLQQSDISCDCRRRPPLAGGQSLTSAHKPQATRLSPPKREDVKFVHLSTSRTRDNLISEETGRSGQPSRVAKAVKSDAADESTSGQHLNDGDNCSHCRAHQKSSSSYAAFKRVCDPPALACGVRNKAKRLPVGKFPAPAGELLCNNRVAISHSPAAANNKPVGALCRSSSELVGSVLGQSGKLAAPGAQEDDHKANLLLGRLRSSLLKGRATTATTSNQSTTKPLLLGHRQLASSQISLAPESSKTRNRLATDTDFDDNFILKRKTPTAGLKLRAR